MTWDFTNERPIFQQLADQIVQKIISGEYPPGGRMDTVRDLAMMAGVNPNTVQRSLAEIENRGLIYTKRGDGRYVTEETALIQKAKALYLEQKTREFMDSLRNSGIQTDEILAAVARLGEKKGE